MSIDVAIMQTEMWTRKKPR